MPVEVHQLLPNLDVGDAISNHTLEIRDILRSRGYISNIYARYIHSKVKDRCYLYTEHKKRSSSKNIVILHHSIGSEVSEYVKAIPDKKIMIYHNITPAHFFAPYDSHLTYLVKKGREELKDFSNVPLLALGDSQYNTEELISCGYPNVDVLPIIVNFKSLEAAPNRNTMDKYNDRMTNILFVGRIVPNKKHEDVIKAFYFYQKYVNPNSRLFLAGSHHPNLGSYSKALSELVDKLGVKNVIFTGHVSHEELMAYYRLSHVFLCMSEHEGFCVPILEAMHFNIPVLAFASCAVPETMGKAGIVFKEKRYEEVAELINLIVSDNNLREKVILAQNKRLLDFGREKIADRLIAYIDAVKVSRNEHNKKNKTAL